MVTGKSGEHPSEIEVRDLQELIRVLTQDEWQPSQPKSFGCGLFTTEMLEAAAGSLERLDDLNQTNEPPMLLFFEPPSLDDRIINQSAVFSIMTAPDGDLGEWFLQHPELCRKVVIPAHLKWPIRNHLDQANVTERVLFPALDGLCRWLARYYGDRPEKMYPMPENGQADHDMET